MKTKYIFIGIAVVALVGVGIVAYPNLLSNTGFSPQTEGIIVKDKKLTENTPPFIVDISYPFIEGNDDFNVKVKEIIDEELTAFKKSAQDNDNAIKETDPESYTSYPREYNLTITYMKGQADQEMVSTLFGIYKYEGGAHGINYFAALNYDVQNKKKLTLADVFKGNSNYLQEVSDFTKQELEKQMQEKLGSLEGTWVQDGAGPQAENFSAFLVNKDNITFYFAPYQVAPYAAGNFEVVMPK